MIVRCSFRYDELLSLYKKFLVYLKKVGKHSISLSSVPELLGRYFGKDERQAAGLEEDPAILSQFFLNHEFTEAPPELHVKTLSAFVTMSIDSKSFRTYVATLEEKLHELRKTRWARPTKKKDLEAQISTLDKKTLEMDRQIDTFESNKSLLDSLAATSTDQAKSEDKVMDLTSSPGTRVSGATERLLAKQKADEEKEKEAKRNQELHRLVDTRNGYVNTMKTLQIKLKKIEGEDEEFRAEVDEINAALRGDAKRVLGLDRDGRIFWHQKVRGKSGDATKHDVSEDPLFGVLIETVFYDVLEETVSVFSGDLSSKTLKGKSAEKKRRSKKSKKKRQGKSEDEESGDTSSSYDPSDSELSESSVDPVLVNHTNLEYDENGENGEGNKHKVMIRFAIESFFEFVDSLENLQGLLRAMNDRGFRERHLKQAIGTLMEKEKDILLNFEHRKRVFLNYSNWIKGRKVIPYQDDDLPDDLPVVSYEEHMLTAIRSCIPMIATAFEVPEPEVYPKTFKGYSDLVQGWNLTKVIMSDPLFSNLNKELNNIKTLSGFAYWCEKVEALGAEMHEREEAKKAKEQNISTSSRTRSDRQDPKKRRHSAPAKVTRPKSNRASSSRRNYRESSESEGESDDVATTVS